MRTQDVKKLRNHTEPDELIKTYMSRNSQWGRDSDQGAMDRVLVVFVLLWSSGLQIEESDLFKEHRLVNRPSRCSAKLQVYDTHNVDLDFAHKVCRSLDCGSVVRTSLDLWGPLPIIWNYTRSGMRHFRKKRSPLLTKHLDIICSDSVRLVDGTSLCSGRLELKSKSWSSVCEADFDQQDAEVVCRELGCGPPSVLQGELNGEAEAPTWTKEFQCGGNESALLDCKSSDSVQTSCPSGQAVRLTCSEPDIVRLVGGSSRCAGVLEVKQQGEWRTVDEHTAHWNLETADVVCRALNCGSAVSTRRKKQDYAYYKWTIRSTCLLSGSAFRECVYTMREQSTSNLEVICSDSVRLVNGSSSCSGRLEVKSDQSDQRWSSVCEADFDQQDAEVVCRELGCGPPSVLQGELNGEAEAPTWTKEFQCGGNESALLDCKSSDSVQTSCPSGQAVRLTCSEPDIVRLVGGSSRCAGVLEVKQQGEWRTVDEHTAHWNLETADVVCRALNCGSAVSTGRRNKQDDAYYKWSIRSTCLLSGSAFRQCVYTKVVFSTFNLEVICSDLLLPAFISSTHTDGVSEATQQGFQVLLGSDFTITCFIQPQYPGGSFQLMFTTSATSQNYTQPAVNHSAHFLFSAASHAHQGEYRCVYHVYVFSHNFSSESRTLAVTVSASLIELLIRLVVLVLVLVLIVGSSAAVLYYYKATRGQPPKQEDNMELDYLGGAEDCPGEEAGARGTD
ncbi:scavenger receptor cysteine-rich type 1 protein M130-like isoform X1 [Larimichthys crocea]|uniref:scavenger receptor cysteine-rich type 1 protein M130-like isoform X1 n=1 Tax=Larimichthys crocea TaxID=215358 RepID=UPI000F5DF723|nr:scavenger receptor cysteine-rich type 1 protein M130-like isoform X1 [Larimichthys crocea]